eukprot:5905927-Prorocentrum_lima.AAC.1
MMWAWLVDGFQSRQPSLRMREEDGPERCPEIKGFSIYDLKEECIRAGIPYQPAATMVTAAQLD